MITENGECPKYAYIDVSAFNEVCFDSDGEFCKSKDKRKARRCWRRQRNKGILRMSIRKN